MHKYDHVFALVLDQWAEKVLEHDFRVMGCICSRGIGWVQGRIGSVHGRERQPLEYGDELVVGRGVKPGPGNEHNGRLLCSHDFLHRDCRDLYYERRDGQDVSMLKILGQKQSFV